MERLFYHRHDDDYEIDGSAEERCALHDESYCADCAEGAKYTDIVSHVPLADLISNEM
jgi:hypothetical protein